MFYWQIKYYAESSLIFLLFLTFLFDPTGEMFNLRYISTLTVFIIYTLRCYFSAEKFSYSIVPLLIIFCLYVFMPIYGLFITSFNIINLLEITDRSYVSFALFGILLIPIFIVHQSVIWKMAILSLRVLKYGVFLVLFVLLVIPDFHSIIQFFIDHNSLLNGLREYGGALSYNIWFTSSPLLVILATYDSCKFFDKPNLILFFIFLSTLVALVLTGTRVNMLLAVLIPLQVYLFKKVNFSNVFYFTIFGVVFLFVLFRHPYVQSFFNNSEASNSVKIGYLSSYFSILSDPIVFIFGQGFDAHSWSMEFSNVLIVANNVGTKTELTFFEIFRVFGFGFGSLFFLIIISIPFFVFLRHGARNYYFLSSVIYLSSCSFNPYLFSINGIFFLTIILSSLKPFRVSPNYDAIK
jgi:hypothetical protein